MHHMPSTFYFTLGEVACIAMTFFHRRLKNLREVPILSLKKTILNRYSIYVIESKKLISVVVHDI
jgi:hypothetical protein